MEKSTCKTANKEFAIPVTPRRESLHNVLAILEGSECIISLQI